MERNYLLDEELFDDIEEGGVYSEEVREQQLEDDELTPEEVGFMRGYDEAYV